MSGIVRHPFFRFVLRNVHRPDFPIYSFECVYPECSPQRLTWSQSTLLPQTGVFWDHR